MDYLDPKKKKASIRRLYLGYGLIAIAIGLATLIMLYLGSGFYPSSDGTLIQNGMLYINSSPAETKITLNGKEQRSQTDARLVVPGGVYDILLTRDGYRPWERTINLEDGKVRRIAYPRLFPISLRTNVVQTTTEQPDLVSGSPDRRFLLSHFPSNPLNFVLMSTERPYDAPVNLGVPVSEVDAPQSPASVEVVEWTEDARFCLIKRNAGGALEYLVLDREQPGLVINVTRRLALPADAKVSMRDRAYNRYVVLLPAAKTISYVDLDSPSTPSVVATGAVDFVSFESDKVLFISELDTDKMRAQFYQAGKTYQIKDLSKSDKYFLELAKFGRMIVMIVGSAADGKVSVYRNPAEYLRSNSDKTFPLATATLKVDKPRFASFSTDASIAMLYGEQQFATHEFDADRSYNFDMTLPYDSSQEIRWMDGARFNVISDNTVYAIDFDGSNQQKLVAARPQFGVYFDKDYKNLFSFLVNKDSSLYQVTETALTVQ